jgi:hypothetical protein
MSTITYTRITVGDREVPASFHDALLKLKDATAKQWVSLESDGAYLVLKGDRKIHCAIGYLLPPEFRKQLVDSDKFVKDLPEVLGVEQYELETMMGVAMEDAIEIQTKFDELSRNYLTATHQRYVRSDAIKAAFSENRKAWNEFLTGLFARENYSFE